MARVADGTFDSGFDLGTVDDFFGGTTSIIDDALDTDALVTEIEEEVVNVQVMRKRWHV